MIRWELVYSTWYSCGHLKCVEKKLALICILIQVVHTSSRLNTTVKQLTKILIRRFHLYTCSMVINICSNLNLMPLFFKWTDFFDRFYFILILVKCYCWDTFFSASFKPFLFSKKRKQTKITQISKTCLLQGFQYLDENCSRFSKNPSFFSQISWVLEFR